MDFFSLQYTSNLSHHHCLFFLATLQFTLHYIYLLYNILVFSLIKVFLCYCSFQLNILKLFLLFFYQYFSVYTVLQFSCHWIQIIFPFVGHFLLLCITTHAFKGNTSSHSHTTAVSLHHQPLR